MLLDKLDYVIAVAEEQNITRAAQRLFISQPTLTLYLNRLEQEFNRPCIAAYRDSSIKMPMIQDFIDIVQREVVPMVSF